MEDILSSDKFSRLRNEIAVKHGISIGNDDPILMIFTLNEFLFNENIERQSTLLEEFHSKIELISGDWSDETTKKAEHIINSSIKASTNTITNAIDVSRSQNDKIIRVVLDELKADIDSSIKDAKIVAKINIFASLITLISACTLIAVFMFR